MANYLSIACHLPDHRGVVVQIHLPFRLVLVATIELAIFLNQGLSYFTGASTAFIAPTIISCVQLGATVDYAILMTSRFQEELQSWQEPRKEAIRIAADFGGLLHHHQRAGAVLRHAGRVLRVLHRPDRRPSASCWPAAH